MCGYRHPTQLRPGGVFLYLQFFTHMRIVFIDGMNFIRHIRASLRRSGIQQFALADYPYADLLREVLCAYNDGQRIIFYISKIKKHPNTPRLSTRLQEERRALSLNIRNSGIEFVFAGLVRGHSEKDDTGRSVVTFKEKGVDVRIAVDMVAMACDDIASTVVLVSSDSDFQPAVAEVKRRGVCTEYIGFEQNPNRGLQASTDRAVLMADSAVLSYV